MPQVWGDAGSAVYGNSIGVNPQLNDPENGDYSLAPSSPAIGQGCQTFSKASSTALNTIAKSYNLDDFIKISKLKNSEVGGEITENTVWDADTIFVNDDVIVNNGVLLVVNSGTTILFQGYYKLMVKGQFLSLGTPENRICYTINNPNDFQLDSTHVNCWGGIRFDNTSSVNDTSKIKYSIIEYSKATKATSDSIGFWERSGGGLLVRNFSKLIVENNIFQNNLADYGGAISAYYNSSPVISNNLIINNYAIYEGAACIFIDGNPIVIGNTIVDNTVLNSGQYIETSGVCTLHAKPFYLNNIAFDNTYNPEVLKYCKIFFTYNNNIENFGNYNQNNVGNNNTNKNPILKDDYSLALNSICIDNGTTMLFNKFIPQKDIFGNDRIIGSSIDIGAIEYNESALHDVSFANDFELFQNYPNPFNPTTEIRYSLPVGNYKNIKISVYNSKGQEIWSIKNLQQNSTICRFNGDRFNTGIYYYSLFADGKCLATKKMVMIK